MRLVIITASILSESFADARANILKLALGRPMPDYEDAVQDAAAECAGIPTIVTRNSPDFAGATRRIVAPTDFLNELNNLAAP